MTDPDPTSSLLSKMLEEIGSNDEVAKTSAKEEKVTTPCAPPNPVPDPTAYGRHMRKVDMCCPVCKKKATTEELHNTRDGILRVYGHGDSTSSFGSTSVCSFFDRMAPIVMFGMDGPQVAHWHLHQYTRQ